MKNTFVLLITLILWLECHAQNATKNYWEFGYQVYGLPVPDMDTPLGIILKAGYDIVPYKKKLIVSVQPYIGGGLFAQTNSQGITDYDFNYKYNILARTRKLKHGSKNRKKRDIQIVWNSSWREYASEKRK